MTGKQETTQLSMWWMLLAVFGFSCIDASAKWLVENGVLVLQVVFVRYLGHFFVSFLIFWPKEQGQLFSSRAKGWQCLRAIALLLATGLNFKALSLLPLTTTTAIMFASPIVVTTMGVCFLQEKISRLEGFSILLGFLGVLIVLRPSHHRIDIAHLYSLLALLSASTYFVLTRSVALADSNGTSQMYTSGIAVLFLLPFVSHFGWSFSDGLWTVILSIGALGAVSHSLLTHAHKFAKASTLAPIIYCQLLFATLQGALLFKTLPDSYTLLGAGLIMGSGFLLWKRQKKARCNAGLSDHKIN